MYNEDREPTGTTIGIYVYEKNNGYFFKYLIVKIIMN